MKILILDHDSQVHQSIKQQLGTNFQVQSIFTTDQLNSILPPPPSIVYLENNFFSPNVENSFHRAQELFDNAKIVFLLESISDVSKTEHLAPGVIKSFDFNHFNEITNSLTLKGPSSPGLDPEQIEQCKLYIEQALKKLVEQGLEKQLWDMIPELAQNTLKREIKNIAAEILAK